MKRRKMNQFKKFLNNNETVIVEADNVANRHSLLTQKQNIQLQIILTQTRVTLYKNPLAAYNHRKKVIN